jgi:hypothetical protein
VKQLVVYRKQRNLVIIDGYLGNFAAIVCRLFQKVKLYRITLPIAKFAITIKSTFKILSAYQL